MSRLRHITKSFALLACLAFLLAALGCSSDSVLAPVEGSGGDDAGSFFDGSSSAPKDKSDDHGPLMSEFSDVGG